MVTQRRKDAKVARNVSWLSLFFRSCWFLLLVPVLAACQPDNEPLATIAVTRVTPTAAATTAVPLPTYTPTLPATATNTAMATAAATPVSTPIGDIEAFYDVELPTLTPRPTRAPTLTPTATPPLGWNAGIEVITTIGNGGVTWSPNRNEFLYNTCPFIPSQEPGASSSVFLVDITNPNNPKELAGNLICPEFGLDMDWTPDGEQILFTGLTVEEATAFDDMAFIQFGNIWKVPRQGGTATVLVPHDQVHSYWAPSFQLWLDGETVLTNGYSSGGHWMGVLLDIVTGEQSTPVIVHTGDFYERSLGYISATSGNDSRYQNFAFAASITDWYEADNPWGGAHINILSDEFSSTFQDWLPGTAEMLVVTWAWEDSLIDTWAPTQLQLWNVETDELQLLADDSFYGRYSQDGRLLVYLTGSPDAVANLHLLDRQSGQIIFTTPTWISFEQFSFNRDHAAFSPDDQYLTFYTDEPMPAMTTAADSAGSSYYLNVLEIASGTILLSVPADNPFIHESHWSPDGRRFLYEDEQKNWTVVDLPEGERLPLTVSSGYRLGDPQWSFDGRYLSFSVDYDGGTAVLLAP
jgi:Tol biopolymer transport system component